MVAGFDLLVSRHNNAFKRFLPLNKALPKLPIRNAVLDGEIVCPDVFVPRLGRVRVYNDGNTGVVSYRASQHISIKGKGPMHYDERTFEVLVKRNGNWRAIDHAVVDKCPKIFVDSHQSTFDVSLGPAQSPHFWKNAGL